MKTNKNFSTNGKDDIIKIDHIHMPSCNSPGHPIAKSFGSYFNENQFGNLASCEMVDGSKKSPLIKDEEIDCSTAYIRTNTSEFHDDQQDSVTPMQPAHAKGNSTLPISLRYLKKKGYDIERDPLGFKKNPESVFEVLSQVTERIEKDTTSLITITEANWDEKVPILAKMIRKELEGFFKNIGLEFLLKSALFKKLPGEKGTAFKTRMDESKLEDILDELEGIFSLENHPLYIAEEAFSLFQTGHDLDEKSVAIVSRFVDVLNSFETDDKRLIFLVQATCHPDLGLPYDWDKETSFSNYLYKARLRKCNLRVNREIMNSNNTNSKNSSNGRVYKPSRKSKHKRNSGRLYPRSR